MRKKVMFESTPEHTQNPDEFLQLSVEEYLNSIKFTEVNSHDESSITVSVEDVTDTSEIKNELYDEIIKRSWWLQDYWQNKGKPTEQIDFGESKNKISLYSFLENKLEDHHIENIRDAIEGYAHVLEGKALDKIRFILFDNDQKINPNDGKKQNGRCRSQMRSVILYPNATETQQHRVPKADNLEGTVIHELTHPITNEISDMGWRETFGWYLLNEPEELPGGKMRHHKTTQPEKCVTDYAKTHPDEDMCESMVAALQNPAVLDEEKLNFIKENLLRGSKHKEELKAEKKRRPKVPSIDEPITYSVKENSGLEIIDTDK